MTISRLVRNGAIAILCAIALTGLVAAWGIAKVRVGGPLQIDIDRSGELIADILPPPAYIIEAYLSASLIVVQPGDVARQEARLKTLRKDYDSRIAYWKASGLPDDMRRQVARDVDPPARRFWSSVEQGLLPAARAGDATAVRRHFAAAAEAYQQHRDAVDALVRAANAYRAEVTETADATLLTVSVMLAIFAVAVVALVCAAVLVIRHRAIVPLARIAGTTEALAEGRDVAIEGLDRTDEIGTLARAIASFCRAAQSSHERDKANAENKMRIAQTLADILGKMAEGDLRNRVDADLPPEYHAVGTNLNHAVGNLRSMVQTVIESAGTISSAATQIAGASASLAGRTEASAAAVEQVSSAVAEVDRHSRTALTVAHDGTARAGDARSAVGRGRDLARAAAQAMARIRDTADNVTDVMEALDKIAFQTRVLAMNAAVEAGNAGEAGRGFAVVADLVAQLAGRAEQEAARARTQLTAIIEEIALATDGVADVEQEFGGIVAEVEAVGGLLDRLSTATNEQSRIIAEVSGTMRQLDDTVQQNAAMVEETSASAASLMQDARTMLERANAFKWDRRSRDLPVTEDRRGGARPRLAAPSPVRHAVRAAVRA